MSVPIVVASLHLNPAILAAREAPENLPHHAVTIMAMAYPQILPVLSKPRSVESPDIMKYLRIRVLAAAIPRP